MKKLIKFYLFILFVLYTFLALSYTQSFADVDTFNGTAISDLKSIDGTLTADIDTIDGQTIASAASGVTIVGSPTLTGVVDDSTKTESVTVGSGSDRALIVSIAWYGAGKTVTSIVYNGSESFTQESAYADSDGYRNVALWYLAAPTTTTANVVITLSATALFAASITQWTGVDGADVFHDTTQARGETAVPTVTVANVLSDEVVITSGHMQGADVALDDGDMTNHMLVDLLGGSNYWAESSIDDSSTGSVTMLYSKTGTNWWALIGAALNKK